MPRIVESKTYTPQQMTVEARRALSAELFEVVRETFTLTEEMFYASQLESKAHLSRILVHRSEEGKVVGFFSLHFFDKVVRGEPSAVLRVIVGMLRAYRGNRSNIAWSMKEVLRYMASHPGKSMYGLSITVHPTTYMMVARYVDAFWPKPGEEVPADVAKVMSELADEFGYVAEDLSKPLVRAAGASSRVSEAERGYWRRCDKPAARAFVSMVPNYYDGYGVVTFARLTPRMFLRGAGILLQDRVAQVYEAAFTKAMQTPLGARFLGPREIARRLRGVSLFASIDPESLDEIAIRAEVVSIAGGRYLFREGDEGSDMYLIAAGSVAVLMRDEEEGERMIDQLAPGAFFGEIAALSGGRRTASIKAAIPSMLIKIPRETLLSVMDANPSLADAVWRALGARILNDHLRASGVAPDLDERPRGELVTLGAGGAIAGSGDAFWVLAQGDAVIEEGESRRAVKAPEVIAVGEGSRLVAGSGARVVRVPLR